MHCAGHDRPSYIVVDCGECIDHVLFRPARQRIPLAANLSHEIDKLSNPHFFPYRAFFPRSKGMYLYLIMCL